MTWLVKMPDGVVVDCDDFTLSDLEQVEKESGTSWSVANVLRDAKVAKAFLRVAYRLHGLDPEDVAALPLRRLKHVFDFREDEPWPEVDADLEDGDPLGSTSPGSSPGEPAGTTGPRKRPAASG